MSPPPEVVGPPGPLRLGVALRRVRGETVTEGPQTRVVVVPEVVRPLGRNLTPTLGRAPRPEDDQGWVSRDRRMSRLSGTCPHPTC